MLVRLRRLQPELVSDYFGPHALSAQVAAEQLPTAPELLAQAMELLSECKMSSSPIKDGGYQRT